MKMTATLAVVFATLVLLVSSASAAIQAFTVNDPAEIAWPKDGTITVSGTVQCTATDQDQVFVNVTQTQGRTKSVVGFGSLAVPITCDGTVQPWEVVIPPAQQVSAGTTFKPGPARITATDEDLTDFSTSTVDQVIHLHPTH